VSYWICNIFSFLQRRKLEEEEEDEEELLVPMCVVLCVFFVDV
jgi:hypothetical protein